MTAAEGLIPSDQGDDYYLSAIRRILQEAVANGMGQTITGLPNVPNQGKAADLRDIARFLATLVQTPDSGVRGFKVVTEDYNILPTDHTVVLDGSLGEADGTLPFAANVPGKMYFIRRIGPNSHDLFAQIGDEFVGAEDTGIWEGVDNASLIIQSDGGTRWHILSGFHYSPA